MLKKALIDRRIPIHRCRARTAHVEFVAVYVE